MSTSILFVSAEMWALAATVVFFHTTFANIALNKTTYSSSLLIDDTVTGSFKAVDGNPDGTWPNGACFATNVGDITPWWMVDLLADFVIDNITITNRLDADSDRLHDFRIEVFAINPVRCPSAAAQLCKQYDGTFGSVETLTCDSQVIGRFLRLSKFIVNSGNDIFTLCEVDVQGIKQAPSVNIALNKTTYSSSLLNDNTDPGSFKAVDGNPDGAWMSGSCFATNINDMNPWWMVDLLTDFVIDNITITNRLDADSDRLHDFKIEVFTTNPVGCASAAAQLCKQYDGTFGSVETLTCDSQVIGRFLRLTNIARNKPTYSSSTLVDNADPVSFKAVDGNPDGAWMSGSCFATNIGDMNPWWMVDLLTVFVIDNITITNRLDADSWRLHDFKIEVFTANPVLCPSAVSQLCKQYDGAFGSVRTMTCDSEVIGRFLRLSKLIMWDANDLFAFCEIEVHGQKQPPANLARNKPTYSSSTLVDNTETGSCSVVDGTVDGGWMNGGCFANGINDMTPWWMVDLMADFVIDNITITNRLDAESGRLHDFKIELFTTNPVLSPGATGQLCKQYDGTFGSVETLTCDSQVIGRFLRLSKFIMNSGTDIFTLCEVEVQGQKQAPSANLARNKPIYSSSTYMDVNDMEAWWMVDLLADFVVDDITISNSLDYHSGRLHDFKIEVFTTNPVRCPSATGQLCKQYNGTFGSVETLTCDSQVVGRFLRLSKFIIYSGTDIFTICEVEVQGIKQAPCDADWQSYPRVPNTKLDNPPTATTNVQLIDCTERCFHSGSCVAFNYKTTTGECQHIHGPTSSDNKTTDENFDYYGKDFC